MTADEGPAVRLPVFKTCKDTRYENGIRIGNYTRYRRYCSRRLKRVRKLVNFKQGRKRYQKKELSAEKVTSARHLEIPLLNAERAWAYAMEVFGAIQELEEGEGLVKHHHLVGRIRRAVAHSKELLALCDAKAGPVTRLEAFAYYCLMDGVRAFHEKNYKEAFVSWISTKGALGVLAETNPGSAAVYSEKLQDVERRLTECGTALEINDGSDAVRASEVEGEKTFAAYYQPLRETLGNRTATGKADAVTVENFEWAGDTWSIPIRSLAGPLARLAKLKSQLATETDHSKIASGSVTVMTICHRALEVLQKDLAQIESGGTSHKSVTEPFYALQDMLSFEMSRLHITRNCSLASVWRAEKPTNKKHSPKDFVYLYDKQLDLCARGGFSSPLGQGAQQTVRQVFSALRAFYVAEAYLAKGAHAEAVVLFEHCEPLFATAEAKCNTWPSQLPSQLDLLRSFRKDARRRQVEAQAQSILALNNQGGAEGPTRVALESRKMRWDAGDPAEHHNLVAFPPQFEPVVPKPVVFDNAWQFLHYPDMSSRVAKKSGGGLLSGWF